MPPSFLRARRLGAGDEAVLDPRWAAVRWDRGSYVLDWPSRLMLYVTDGAATFSWAGESLKVAKGDLIELEGASSWRVDVPEVVTLSYRFDSDLQDALEALWAEMARPRATGRFDRVGIAAEFVPPRTLVLIRADTTTGSEVEDALFALPRDSAALEEIDLSEILQWRFDSRVGGPDAFDPGMRELVANPLRARLASLGLTAGSRPLERHDAASGTHPRLAAALLALELKAQVGPLEPVELLVSDKNQVLRWVRDSSGIPLVEALHAHVGRYPTVDLRKEGADDRVVQSLLEEFWKPNPPTWVPKMHIPFEVRRLALGNGISVSRQFCFRWWIRVVALGPESLVNCEYYSVERTVHEPRAGTEEWIVWHRDRWNGSAWRFRTSKEDDRVLEREYVDGYD